MADEVTANTSGPTSTVAQGKGKEKAPVVQDMSMDEEEDSSEGETGAEDEVSAFKFSNPFPFVGFTWRSLIHLWLAQTDTRRTYVKSCLQYH